ncbi:MAG TPA: SPFH domain-containing protein [Acidobacteriaceae bacterium]|jgi:regulator of protease activity HflC (stomatin/prohibitin superfamily)|nr:SPFH domain-containing protein [Acidobacteriaceae bacterium]
MLALKELLIVVGALLLASALGITLYDLWTWIEYRWKLRAFASDTESPMSRAEPRKPEPAMPEPVRWRTSMTLAVAACLPWLIADSILVIPAGMGGVRISQVRGTLPGTLYAGAHFVTPLMESVQMFDLRDKLFTAGVVEGAELKKGALEMQPLDVQSKEGLDIGLAITVRYRLDPKRLDWMETHLGQPVDQQMVPAVVASAWRDLAPSYTVREIFSSKREEVRKQASGVITNKLGADGILVEEVMLRNIQLPPEYARGLQDLLLKEQQDDQMAVQTDIQQKQVRIAELQAEAEAAQKVKVAEGDAHARVVEAKGEADAMQYTLPLKQKQIEQSKLEAEARKEATIENADAEAQAKVIDSKAELQRRDLLTQAEANRIRVTAAADAERMASEAKLLNQSPLLINKIIAERLSDKIQMVMVPSDGKYFFASDVFRGLDSNSALKQGVMRQMDPDDPAAAPGASGH